MDDENTSMLESLEDGAILNEMIESNLEMDSLLFESDYVLANAESDLKATTENAPLLNLENMENDSSPCLSINVADDLFKGLVPDMQNMSSLHYTPDPNVHDKKEEAHASASVTSENDKVVEILQDFNESLQIFNICCQYDEEPCDNLAEENDLDKTITNDIVVENDKVSADINAKDNKLNSEESECDIIDLIDSTLEITVINNFCDEENPAKNNETVLKHHTHFEGCSKDFDTSCKENDLIVILENTKDDAEINSHESLSDENKENKLQKANLNKNNTLEGIEPLSELVVDNNDKTLVAEDNNDKTLVAEDNNENALISGDPNDVILIVREQEKQEPCNDEAMVINEQNKSPIEDKSNEVIAIDIPNQETDKNKRDANDIIESDATKKRKINIGSTIVVEINNNPDQKKDCDDQFLSDSQICNFTQAIFDPDETADHNDPKWAALKELKTNEDYFNSVRTQWRSLSLSNPHKDVTTRYVTENSSIMNKINHDLIDRDRAISCNSFIDRRITACRSKIRQCEENLWMLRRSASRNERMKIQNELDSAVLELSELKKNQEELKQINMFYHEQHVGWDANYLTKRQLAEVEQQDKMLKFQMKFYK